MKSVSRTSFAVFIHVFVFVLCFTMDVKVRADVVVRAVTGEVEVEKDHRTLEAGTKEKLVEPFDVQTFANSLMKMDVNSVYLGIGDRSLVSIGEKPRFTVSWGTLFLSAPVKDRAWVSVKTPEGDLSSAGGEFIITVRNKKTFVTTVAGRMEIKDRAGGKTQVVRPGYTAWIGGLLATGSHAASRPEACEFEKTITLVRALGNFTQPEWQHRYDHLKPLWKQAVEDVAQQTQDQVTGDMQILKEIEEADHKREERHRRQDAKLRKMFRAKALGDPGENTEDPSESDRAPASSAE